VINALDQHVPFGTGMRQPKSIMQVIDFDLLARLLARFKVLIVLARTRNAFQKAVDTR
jgi:hypothetical protein